MNYFDLHCDTPYECFFKNLSFAESSLAVSGKKGSVFERWKQVFAVWIRDDAEEPYRLYRSILDGFREKLKDKPDNLTPYFAVEGGAVIEDDIDKLYRLKEDGIRFFTLTWNGENRIAGGSGSDKGLTGFGRRVIEELNRLEISCDLSHLNDKSFYRAAELAKYPVATHSDCRAVCAAPRNLADEQLKLIGEKGGIIGLCFYPKFLGGGVYEALYRNICHMLELGLEDSIALGSDFDGADMGEELSDITKIPLLYAYLNKKGIPAVLLDKIFYKNAENYIETFDKRLQSG